MNESHSKDLLRFFAVSVTVLAGAHISLWLYSRNGEITAGEHRIVSVAISVAIPATIVLVAPLYMEIGRLRRLINNLKADHPEMKNFNAHAIARPGSLSCF
jgi:hypothetical protein